jgi:hypothetical protein
MSMFGTDLGMAYHDNPVSQQPISSEFVHPSMSQHHGGGNGNGNGGSHYAAERYYNDMNQDHHAPPQQPTLPTQPQQLMPQVPQPPHQMQPIVSNTPQHYVNAGIGKEYYTHKEQQSFFGALWSKRKDMIKYLILSIVILLGLSMHSALEYYVKKYILENDLSSKNETLLRFVYPLGVFALLWILKVFYR